MSIVTSLRLNRAWSANSTSRSESFFCLTSVACASTASIEPHSLMSLSAVFGPTPGTPGTLSEESPINPITSMTSSGRTPNFSSVSSGPTSATALWPGFMML